MACRTTYYSNEMRASERTSVQIFPFTIMWMLRLFVFFFVRFTLFLGDTHVSLSACGMKILYLSSLHASQLSLQRIFNPQICVSAGPSALACVWPTRSISWLTSHNHFGTANLHVLRLFTNSNNCVSLPCSRSFSLQQQTSAVALYNYMYPKGDCCRWIIITIITLYSFHNLNHSYKMCTACLFGVLPTSKCRALSAPTMTTTTTSTGTTNAAVWENSYRVRSLNGCSLNFNACISVRLTGI